MLLMSTIHNSKFLLVLHIFSTLSLPQNRLNAIKKQIKSLCHTKTHMHAIHGCTYNSTGIACTFTNRIEPFQGHTLISVTAAGNLNRGTSSGLEEMIK
uniref:Secreted protein n=1 Tax=Rhizophora mucronata TaxID=61149 RepID=A0A2P2KZ65_RHIMU